MKSMEITEYNTPDGDEVSEITLQIPLRVYHREQHNHRACPQYDAIDLDNDEWTRFGREDRGEEMKRQQHEHQQRDQSQPIHHHLLMQR